MDEEDPEPPAPDPADDIVETTTPSSSLSQYDPPTTTLGLSNTRIWTQERYDAMRNRFWDQMRSFEQRRASIGESACPFPRKKRLTSRVIQLNASEA